MIEFLGILSDTTELCIKLSTTKVSKLQVEPAKWKLKSSVTKGSKVISGEIELCS